MKKSLMLVAFLLVILGGCASKDTTDVAKVDKGSYKVEEGVKEKIPKKIITFSPAIIDFINYFNLDVKVLADTTYISKDNTGIVSNKLNGKKLTVEDREVISKFVPDIVFVTRSNAALMSDLASYKTVDISIEMDDYYKSFKENLKKLGKIFGIEKKVNYELVRIDETKGLLQEKAKLMGKKLDVDKEFVDAMLLQIRYFRYQDNYGELFSGGLESFKKVLKNEKATQAEKSDTELEELIKSFRKATIENHGLENKVDSSENKVQGGDKPTKTEAKPKDKEKPSIKEAPLNEMEQVKLVESIIEYIVPGGIGSYKKRLKYHYGEMEENK